MPNKKSKNIGLTEMHLPNIAKKLLFIFGIGLFAHISSLYILTKIESQSFLDANEVAIGRELRNDSFPTEIGEPEGRTIEFYVSELNGRDLFLQPWDKPRNIENRAIAKQANFSNQYRLVGILIDDDPKAILEEIKTQQTYFISVGETISTAVLDNIQEDKVTFIFNGQPIEMTQ